MLRAPDKADLCETREPRRPVDAMRAPGLGPPHFPQFGTASLPSRHYKGDEPCLWRVEPMTRPCIPPLLHFLRARFGFAAARTESDGLLLRHFAQSHDEAAFEALLRRHGPLVWG